MEGYDLTLPVRATAVPFPFSSMLAEIKWVLGEEGEKNY